MACNSRGSRIAENCVVGRIHIRRFISQHLSRPIYAFHALQSLQRDPTVALEKHLAINARGAVAGCPRALCAFPFRRSVGSSTFSKCILHVDQAFSWKCSVSRRVLHRPTSTPNATSFLIGCTLKLKPWIRQWTNRRRLCCQVARQTGHVIGSPFASVVACAIHSLVPQPSNLHAGGARSSFPLVRTSSCTSMPTLVVHGSYLCALRMVNSGYLDLEKILPPQVGSSLLEGPKEWGHPLAGRVDVA